MRRALFASSKERLRRRALISQQQSTTTFLTFDPVCSTGFQEKKHNKKTFFTQPDGVSKGEQILQINMSQLSPSVLCVTLMPSPSEWRASHSCDRGPSKQGRRGRFRQDAPSPPLLSAACEPLRIGLTLFCECLLLLLFSLLQSSSCSNQNLLKRSFCLSPLYGFLVSAGQFYKLYNAIRAGGSITD